MSYTTAYQIAQAIAAGAGDKPGQEHVDDWARRTGADAAPLSSLFGQMGYGNIEGGGLLDYDTAQRQLAAAQKYDPSASLEKVGDSTDDYGTDENGQKIAKNNYILKFDKSKLPKFAAADAKGIVSDSGMPNSWISLNEDNAGQRVRDNKYIVKDPNYGDYTIRGNVNQSENDKMDNTWRGVDTIARMIGNYFTGGAQGLMMAGGNYLSNADETGHWGGGGLRNIAGSVASSYSPYIGYMIQLANMLKQQKGKG